MRRLRYAGAGGVTSIRLGKSGWETVSPAATGAPKEGRGCGGERSKDSMPSSKKTAVQLEESQRGERMVIAHLLLRESVRCLRQRRSDAQEERDGMAVLLSCSECRSVSDVSCLSLNSGVVSASRQCSQSGESE